MTIVANPLSNCLIANLPSLVAAVPLLPLVAAGGIAGQMLAHRRGFATLAAADEAERPTARLALGAALAVLLILLAIDLAVLLEPAPGPLSLGNWFVIAGAALPLSFSLDALALSIATLVALIAVITLRFSQHYLHREAGFHRFFLSMAVFLAGMLLIVLAGNAVLGFVGWELCGISSFLLIAYAYERPVATGNALFAFLSNRIGDAGFLIAIGLAFVWIGTVEWSEIGRGGRLDLLVARLVALGLVAAALAKSAQLPFASWLARALEGPTPSSAIFYGAVMVHAGVYLLIRAEPLLVQVPDVMVLVAVLGAATALYGWLAGLVQTDVKSALLFAAQAQVGLMFLACGLGWFELAAWHMALHMAWRSWQFLLAPSYMHLVRDPPAPPPRWLAGREWLHTAALQRLWLDPMAGATLLRPVLAMAGDARRLDEDVIGVVAGAPAVADDAIESPGSAGRLLLWLSGHFQRFEERLVWHGHGGPMTRLLQSLAAHLREIEASLEQPRYLLLLVAAIFVVIL